MIFIFHGFPVVLPVTGGLRNPAPRGLSHTAGTARFYFLFIRL